MAFRDDAEAARARADALERENKALRADLARAQAGDDGQPVAGGEMPSDDDEPAPPASGLRGIALGAGGRPRRQQSKATTPRATLPLVLAPAALGLVLLWVSAVLSLLLVVRPGELVVVAGRPHRRPDGTIVDYRIVRRGRLLRLPFLENVQRIDLRPINVLAAVTNAYTRDHVPAHVEAHCLVRIDHDERRVCDAIERFLGRPRPEIARVACETIEGSLRTVAVQRTLDELQGDARAFSLEVIDAAERDLQKMGLRIDALSVTSVVDGRRSG